MEPPPPPLLSRPPSPVAPPERPSLVDFLPFDRDTRLEDTTEFLDCCSLEYSHPGKITVVSSQPRRHHHPSSLSPEDCELDASYSEIVEAPWTKGSRSDGGSCGHSCRSSVSEGSGCRLQNMHDGVSDTDSMVASAPIHGPAPVRCVCICKKRNCKFVDKPYDAESVRESPISGVSFRYRLVTWLSALAPPRKGTDSSLGTDQLDVAIKVHPEKRSKIIQVLRCGQWRGSAGHDKDKCPGAALGQCPGLNCGKRVPLPAGLRRLRGCKVSVPRTIGVMLGMALVLLGVTYDHGIKHGVDNILQDCWSWLRTSYMNFGDEFVSYNSIFFRMNNSEVLYGEPYPNYVNKTAKKTGGNGTSFQDAIKKVDPKFLYVLEGLKLSVQLHFFSLDKKSEKDSPKVLVHDQGPLFFRISFKRTVGLQIDYIARRSSMTLKTPFQIYDLMKLIFYSNDLPYFGMHMHDYIETTPSSLFSMIIDNLKKFKVDTTFLSSIQAQIQKGRRYRRDAEVKKKEVKKPSVEVPVTQKAEENLQNTVTIATERPTMTPTIITTSAAGTRRASGTTSAHPTTSLFRNSTSSLVPLATTLERIRRSTEEPTLRQVAWRSLSEISKKIFLPLPLDTKKSILLTMPFIEKNLTLKFRHSVNVLGLPGYQFVLGNDIMKNGSPWRNALSDLYPSLSYSRVKDNESTGQDESSSHRHRFNDKRKHPHFRHSKHQNGLESDSYRKSFNEVLGVVDLQPLLIESIGKVALMDQVLENYPFWLSPPHFLSLIDHMEIINKEKYSVGKNKTESNTNGTSSKNLLLGVDGVQANESLHGSFIYYHPVLGVPINASLAVQIGIRPPEGMLHAHKLVPIMWTRIQVEEIPRSLWYILWAACHLRETIMGCFICTGLLIITCSLTCKRKKKKKKKKKGTEDLPDNSA